MQEDLKKNFVLAFQSRERKKICPGISGAFGAPRRYRIDPDRQALVHDLGNGSKNFWKTLKRKKKRAGNENGCFAEQPVAEKKVVAARENAEIKIPFPVFVEEKIPVSTEAEFRSMKMQCPENGKITLSIESRDLQSRDGAGTDTKNRCRHSCK